MSGKGGDWVNLRRACAPGRSDTLLYGVGVAVVRGWGSKTHSHIGEDCGVPVCVLSHHRPRCATRIVYRCATRVVYVRLLVGACVCAVCDKRGKRTGFNGIHRHFYKPHQAPPNIRGTPEVQGDGAASFIARSTPNASMPPRTAS